MSGAISLPAVPMYLSIVKDEQSDVAQFAKSDASTRLAVSKFTAAAPSITSPAGLLQNYSALQVVLGAFGMGGDISETGILKDLMTQDPSSSTSLVKEDPSASYQRFASALSNWSTPPFQSTTTVASVVNQYETTQFEASEGKQIPGMDKALYFTRTIGAVTSINQVMSDPTLMSVVTTALGLPSAFGELDYTQQQNILTQKLNLSQFKTTGGIQSFAEKYLAMNQANQPVTLPTGMASLFSSTGGQSLLDILNVAAGGSAATEASSNTTLSLFA